MNAKEKDDDAPVGFTVDAEHGRALEAAYNYADTVERGLIHMATKAGDKGGLQDDGDLDAVLWSLSYTAAMAKAMIRAGQKGGAQ